jgi:hypothetical protein
LELAKTIERELIWKAREAQNDAIQWGVDVDSSTPSEEGWPGVPVDATWPSPLPGALLHANGWPSVEGGVEVEVEVCSDAVELQREHSACRSLMIISCLSVADLLSSLCHRTIGTSFGSCAPWCRSGSGVN